MTAMTKTVFNGKTHPQKNKYDNFTCAHNNIVSQIRIEQVSL